MTSAIGTVTAAADSPVAALAGRERRRLRRRILIIAAILCVAGYITVQYQSIFGTLRAALATASGAQPVWLVAGLGLTVSSMIAFGVVRRQTLRAAGAAITLRDATNISYRAGAVHLTAPAGSIISTGYVFRGLQQQRHSPAAITWSLAISGVMSTVTLAFLGLIGVAAAGRSAESWTALLPGVLGAGALGIGAWLAVGHPALLSSIADSGLRVINRVLRRPAGSGITTVQTTLSDLRQVHPRGRDWIGSLGFAAINWLLDLLCLWACVQAVGLQLSPLSLLTSYALAMAGSSVSPLPGGFGVVDTVLVLGLTATGAPTAAALGAVLLYRVLSDGSVIAIGWTAITLPSVRYFAKPVSPNDRSTPDRPRVIRRVGGIHDAAR